MNTELEPGYYFWKLTAYRPVTGSELLKYVMTPSSLGKIQGLKYAMVDFQFEMGRGWKVTHQALSEKYYSMRLAAMSKKESIWERMLG